MSRKEMLVAFCLVPLIAGCSLSRRPLELEVHRLDAQLAAMRQAEADLAGPDFPPGARHLMAFVATHVFNQVLAGADGLSAPIPGSPDSTLTLDKVRLDTFDGFAETVVTAHASRGAARLDVRVRAEILIDTAQSPPIARLRVAEVAPVLSWRCVRLANLRLAQAVLTAKADELALNHLAFPIPIEQSLTLAAPAVRQEFQQDTPRGNGSWVRVRVTRDAFELRRTLRVDRVLFLRDGLHLFASLN